MKLLEILLKDFVTGKEHLMLQKNIWDNKRWNMSIKKFMCMYMYHYSFD